MGAGRHGRFPGSSPVRASSWARATGRLEQIAPTIAMLTGTPIPAYASAGALQEHRCDHSRSGSFVPDERHSVAFNGHYVDVVTQGNGTINVGCGWPGKSAAVTDEMAGQARAERQAIERNERVLVALAALGAALVVILAIGVVSWRALVAALAGMAGYYVVYNLLFFIGPRLQVVAVGLQHRDVRQGVHERPYGRGDRFRAGAAPQSRRSSTRYLRSAPRGPRDPWFLSGWLALGSRDDSRGSGDSRDAGGVVLLVLRRPHLMGASRLHVGVQGRPRHGSGHGPRRRRAVAPLVTYLVGRYHPKVARGTVAGQVTDSKT